MTTTTIHKTREAWLNAFVEAARPHFIAAGQGLPEKIRVSIGWPSKGVRSNVIGECWSDEVSSDGTFEIFIRPTLQSDASRIADVLTHELVHAAVGIPAGHKAPFRKLAVALGLEGAMTATVAGEAWFLWANPILDDLGPLPGSAMDIQVQSSAGKKQTTRMLKLTCGDCGFSCRTTAKHIEAHPELSCPTGCGGSLEKED